MGMGTGISPMGTGFFLGVDEPPEDLPRRNAQAVITEVIPANVH
jgi:hypothetical protein